jgi:hypothetical protein
VGDGQVGGPKGTKLVVADRFWVMGRGAKGATPEEIKAALSALDLDRLLAPDE